MDSKLSVLVLMYLLDNSFVDMTKACLNSILDQGDELVIVDNGSLVRDPWIEYVADRYVRVKENIGYVRGINLGIKACSGDHVVFVSNDTKLLEGNLRSLAGDGLMFPKVEWSEPRNYPFAHGGFYGFPNEPWVLHNEVFKSHYSDTDLFERAKEMGKPLVEVPSVKIYHKVNSTVLATGERQEQYYRDQETYNTMRGEKND